MDTPKFVRIEIEDQDTGMVVPLEWPADQELPNSSQQLDILSSYYEQNPVESHTTTGRSMMEQYVDPKLPKESITNPDDVMKFYGITDNKALKTLFTAFSSFIPGANAVNAVPNKVLEAGTKAAGLKEGTIARNAIDFAGQGSGAFVNQAALGLPEAALRKQGLTLGEPSTPAGRVGEFVGGVGGNVIGAAGQIAAKTGATLTGRKLLALAGLKKAGWEVTEEAAKSIFKTGLQGAGAGALWGAAYTPETEEGNIIQGTGGQRTFQGVLGGIAGFTGGIIQGKILKSIGRYKTVPKPKAGDMIPDYELPAAKLQLKQDMADFKISAADNTQKLAEAVDGFSEQNAPEVMDDVLNYVKTQSEGFGNVEDKAIRAMQSGEDAIKKQDVLDVLVKVKNQISKEGLGTTTDTSYIDDLISKYSTKAPKQSRAAGFFSSEPPTPKDTGDKKLSIKVLKELRNELRDAKAGIVKKTSDGRELGLGDIGVQKLKTAFNSFFETKAPVLHELDSAYAPYAQLKKSAIAFFDPMSGPYGKDTATRSLKQLASGKASPDLVETIKGLRKPGAFGADPINAYVPDEAARLAGIRKSVAEDAAKTGESHIRRGVTIAENEAYQKSLKAFKADIKKTLGIGAMAAFAQYMGMYIIGRKLVRSFVP